MEIMTLSNTEEFDHESYLTETPITKKSLINYYTMPITRTARNIYIHRGQVSHDDTLLMAIAGVTGVESDFFSMEEQTSHSRTTAANTRLMLDYQMSLDLREESRTVYNFFDVLGNVGGLSGILFSLAAAISSTLTF
mmetsp:Transcript_13143/g.16723  ORF Transcript_13143/g.16723 Transcript_13143/m.16723 type:complete len:137 (-) Transcript_13143:900-1310(-)